MSRQDFSHSEAAESTKVAVVRTPQKTPVITPSPVNRMTVTETPLRVLIISREDESLLQAVPSLDGSVPLQELFTEVHILILRQGRRPKEPVERVADTVWRYTVTAPFWWLTPHYGRHMIEEQLVFATGFRPDLIIARDPFESALLAAKVAKRYKRPTQLHVLEDFSVPEFRLRDRHNVWRKFLPRVTLQKFVSARAATSAIGELLQREQTIKDLTILPRLQKYAELAEAPSATILQETYKPLTFFILYIGKLDHTSTAFRAIDAARFALRNARIGMVILGDGSAKREFQKRAKIHGVDTQIIFETRAVAVDAYLKSANMVLVTDTNNDADEVVLKAAAAGVPLVMSHTQARADLFEDGVSAYLCEETDILSFASRVNELLNNAGLRRVFAHNAQVVMEERFHQDTAVYVASLRESIEAALTIENETNGEAA